MITHFKGYFNREYFAQFPQRTVSKNLHAKLAQRAPVPTQWTHHQIYRHCWHLKWNVTISISEGQTWNKLSYRIVLGIFTTNWPQQTLEYNYSTHMCQQIHSHPTFQPSNCTTHIPPLIRPLRSRSFDVLSLQSFRPACTLQNRIRS